MKASLRVHPFSVEKVWVPTVFSRFDVPAGEEINLAGCENCHVSPRVMEALGKEIEPRLLMEHWESQDQRLRYKLAELHSVDPSQVFLTSGAMGAIRYVFEIFVSSDTKVGLLKPDFPGFVYFADHARAKTVWLVNDCYPFDHQANRISQFANDEGIGLLIFSSPSAVTGTRKSASEVEAILRAAPQTMFIADEADAIDTESVAGLTKTYPNLIVIRSLSKFYGLSGLRIGYLVTPPEFIEHFERTINPAELTSFALVAAMEALDDMYYQRITQEKVRESLTILKKACEGTAYKVVPGSTCFASYVWSDEEVEDPFLLLQRHNINIAQGVAFGIKRGGRINLSDPQKVQVAANALRRG